MHDHDHSADVPHAPVSPQSGTAASGSGAAGHGTCGDSAEPHSHEAGASSERRLSWTLLLITLYMVAEFLGGWWTGSLALMADAGHMLSDAGALAMSLFAARMIRRAPTGQKTYGFHRAEVLAALANGATLFAVAGGITIEAWGRFSEPHAIETGGMLAIAAGGLAVNLAALGVLHGGHQHDMNTRGAWLHVIGDTLGSVAVIAAALLIRATGQAWIDPAVSVLVSLLLLYSAWGLISAALHVLMEHAPSEVEVDRLESAILSAPHVTGVHCLHVWTLGSGKHALSAHVVVAPGAGQQDCLAEIQSRISADFPIGHMTVQIEGPGSTCAGSMPCRLE